MIDLGLLSMRRTSSELKVALDPIQDALLRKELDALFSNPDQVEEAETNLRGYFSLAQP